jgi:lipopolysaccharide assembly LptE-like protein
MAWRCTRLQTIGWVAVLLLISTSCGYHTSAHGVRLPADMHTIYVPAFANATHTYRIEELLTSDVVRELRSRTNYRIVTSNDGSADATLSGTVISVAISPLTYNSQTGGISSSLVFVTMKVDLVGRNGKVLWNNPNLLYREEYQIANNGKNFFEEESPALERLGRDFAQTVVSDMLEAY